MAMDIIKEKSSHDRRIGEMNNNEPQRPVSQGSESQSRDRSLLVNHIDSRTSPPVSVHPAFRNEELESPDSRLMEARQSLISSELELAREEAKSLNQRLTKICQVLREHERALKERECRVTDREKWVSHRERQIRIRERNAREREVQIEDREQELTLSSPTAGSETGKRSLSFRIGSPTIQMTLKDFWQRKSATDTSEHGDNETNCKKPILPKIKTSEEEADLTSTAHTGNAVASSSEQPVPGLSKDSQQRRFPVLGRLSPLTPQSPPPPPYPSASAASSPVEAADTASRNFWKKTQHKAVTRLAMIFMTERKKIRHGVERENIKRRKINA